MKYSLIKIINITHIAISIIIFLFLSNAYGISIGAYFPYMYGIRHSGPLTFNGIRIEEQIHQGVVNLYFQKYFKRRIGLSFLTGYKFEYNEKKVNKFLPEKLKEVSTWV